MRIDIAFFTCPTCGHRSTPPEAVNAFANQMEIIEKVPLKVEKQGDLDVAISVMDKAKTKSDLEKKFKTNTVTIKTEGIEDVARLARSYCKVASQDKTELSESKHVTLACPNCDTLLYEAQVR